VATEPTKTSMQQDAPKTPDPTKPLEALKAAEVKPKKLELKAKITWLGEDDLHGEEQGGPRRTTWRNVEFKKGEAVEITDRYFIEKARNNRFFKVEIISGEETLPPLLEPQEFRTDLDQPKSTSSVSPNQTSMSKEQFDKTLSEK